MAAGWAVGLSMALTGALTVEVHHHCQAVLEAHRFDGEGFLLLPGAAPHFGLDAEAHLEGKGVCLDVSNYSSPCPGLGSSEMGPARSLWAHQSLSKLSQHNVGQRICLPQ